MAQVGPSDLDCRWGPEVLGRLLAAGLIAAAILLAAVWVGVQVRGVATALERWASSRPSEGMWETPALSGEPTVTPEVQAPLVVQVEAVREGGGQIEIEFAVQRRSGTADLLFEMPVLQDEQGTPYRLVDGLEDARFALLDLVTGSQATFSLRFEPAPPGEATGLEVIFNPGRPTHDPVAPEVRVPVPMSGD